MKEYGDGVRVARARFCGFVRHVQRTGDRIAISRGGTYVAMLVNLRELVRLGDPHAVLSVREVKLGFRRALEDCEGGQRIALVRNEIPVAGLIGWADYAKLS